MRPRSLRLRKETLAELSPTHLAKVFGNGPDSGPTCPVPGLLCLADITKTDTDPSRFETCHCCTATASC